MLRTFIAAKIPDNPALRRLHSRLSELGPAFAPISVNNLHVTLKFLGDTDERQVSDICADTQTVAAEHPSEIVKLVGLGAFPHARRPSVIWVGMEGAVSLAAIAAALEARMAERGFPAERRPFHPHVTVLRVNRRPPESLFTMLAESGSADFGTARIESIELLQSELSKGGSRYTVLATAPLSSRE